MSRSDYLTFHKKIALLHLKSLSMGACFDVLVASLKKHSGFKNDATLKTGIADMFKGRIDSIDKLEKFIHSLN